MRASSFASALLAILSFAIGSFLIFYGATQWITNLYTFGFFGLLPYAPLGILLVFISLPIALFGFKRLPGWVSRARSSSSASDSVQEDEDDSPLFFNKRIVGLSLVITGLVWLTLSLFALFATTLFIEYPYPCSINYCPKPTVFTVLFSLGSLVLIAIGVLILVAGIALILMSKGKTQARLQSIRASLASLHP